MTEVNLIEVEPVAEPIPANEADRDGGDHVRSPRPEALPKDRMSPVRMEEAGAIEPQPTRQRPKPLERGRKE